MIHAVYLLNCAQRGPGDPREVARVADPLAARRRRDRRRRRRAAPRLGARRATSAQAIARAGEVIREALAETERCPLHLEDTAGAGGTLGRSFEELAALIEAAGGDERLGALPRLLPPARLRLRRPHRRRAGRRCSSAFDADVGLDRLGSLHLNDSQTPLGSNRDRHANLGEGELGEEGCAAFLSEPRFEGLPGRARDARAGEAGHDAPRKCAARSSLRERGLAARGI